MAQFPAWLSHDLSCSSPVLMRTNCKTSLALQAPLLQRALRGDFIWPQSAALAPALLSCRAHDDARIQASMQRTNGALSKLSETHWRSFQNGSRTAPGARSAPSLSVTGTAAASSRLAKCSELCMLKTFASIGFTRLTCFEANSNRADS